MLLSMIVDNPSSLDGLLSIAMSIGAILFPLIFGLIIAFGDYPYTPIDRIEARYYE